MKIYHASGTTKTVDEALEIMIEEDLKPNFGHLN